MDIYRSNKEFRTEEVESMGNVMIHVIGVNDGMTYAVMSQEDFDSQYELISE